MAFFARSRQNQDIVLTVEPPVSRLGRGRTYFTQLFGKRSEGRQQLGKFVLQRQLCYGDLFGNVTDALAQSDLEPSDVRIEITESTLAENPDEAAELLTRLRERGFRIVIDDFGTGYSSLGSLHRLPLDAFKIDRSFVDKMLKSQHNAAIVRSILYLAENLDIDVVAEGIETEEQRQTLIDLECRLGQGFLFSRPLSVEQVDRLFQSRSSDSEVTPLEAMQAVASGVAMTQPVASQ